VQTFSVPTFIYNDLHQDQCRIAEDGLGPKVGDIGQITWPGPRALPHPRVSQAGQGL